MNLGSVTGIAKSQSPDCEGLLMMASVHKWGAVPPLREPRRGSPIDYGKPHGDGEYDEEDGFDEYEMDNGTWENSSRHSGVARR